jgi:LPS-assembly lipoprotein
MLLSNGTGFSRLGKTIAGVLLLAAVAGCQVRPLYSTASGTEGKLASVSIPEINNRVGQQVRNDLIFLFAGGAGEPQNAAYRLDLGVTAGTGGVLNDPATDTMRAGRTTVSGTFTLVKVDTGETVTSGKRSAIALVDFPRQEFAKLRAIRDAENRAARELAELIRADVATALSRR